MPSLSLAGWAGEDVEFFASARRGDVEEAASLLRFAVAIDAIDPDTRVFRSSPLDGEERRGIPLSAGSLFVWGSFSHFVGQETALEPGEHVGFSLAGSRLQLRDDDDFKFKALRFVDGHELHAGIGCRPPGWVARSAWRGFPQARGRVDPARRWAASRAMPQEVEVDAGRRVGTVVAAQREPELLKPRAERAERDGR